ncbi:MAG: T9SS type A sorting domain-containing protein, partial [Bacteroidota bacterium]
QTIEAGSVLSIEATVEGVISGKELEFSQDGGETWEVIWQSSSPNPQVQYDWIVPSINSDDCLVRATVFQNGEAFEVQNDSTFTIFTSESPTFALSETVSHLYWPFYNPEIVVDGPLHVPSTWQDQEEGVLITKDDVVNTWFFFNDHYWQSSGRWHHSGDNCFAQDWNFINGGNSDCQMHFFSPMAGKILFQKNSCFNTNCNNPTCTSGCGNYFVVQSTEDPTFAYRACHFSELNTEYVVGDEINAGDWMALVGNEGSSTAAHVHFVLYKNLTEPDIERLASGNTLASNRDRSIDPANLSDLCFDKAANFRFDVPLNRTITNIPIVAYQPVHELTVFPNPSDGQFNFRLNADARQFMRLQVFDVMGRVVKDERRKRYQAGETVHLDIGEAIRGMYLLQVRFDQEVVTERILIRK